MESQSSLHFDENEVKNSQVETTITIPEAPPAVKSPTSKPIRETTVDKFKAKKYITLNEIYSQIDAVLYHLQQEGSITSMDGFTEWGITRMSAVIYTLRHTHKIDIDAEDLTIKNKFGHLTTFSKYKLKKETPSPRA